MATDWVKLETTPRIGEASLLKSTLESEGIEAELRGEHRPSIAGELPLPEAEVEVWVPAAELERARAVLQRLRSAADHPPRRCPRCGEENPGAFEVCWRCGVSLDDAAGPERAVDPLPISPPRKSRAVWGGFAVGLFLAGVGGYQLGKKRAEAEAAAPIALPITSEWDSSGRCVHQRMRSTGKSFWVQCDDDRDGAFERMTSFDREGQKTGEMNDTDEDGFFEHQRLFDREGRLVTEVFDDRGGRPRRYVELDVRGRPSHESRDENGNGRIERHLELREGRVVIESRDLDEDGWLDEYVEHRRDDLTATWTDTDRDGLFDRRRLVDASGKLVRVDVDRGPSGFAAADAGP